MEALYLTIPMAMCIAAFFLYIFITAFKKVSLKILNHLNIECSSRKNTPKRTNLNQIHLMDQLANLSFFGSIILYGFVSSFHCLVMCGPFVSLLQTEKGKQIPIYLYHLGRLISYTFLGMVLGFLGKGANALGELSAVQGVAGVLTFLFLVVFAIRTYSTKSTSSFGSLPQGIRKFLEKSALALVKMVLGLELGW